MSGLSDNKYLLHDFWKKHRIITNEWLLSTFLEVPRENFIRPGSLSEAYADHPLPIGEGQTISQPTTVMLMLQLLEIQPDQKILEIGTGSGYNAAILASMAKQVITIETIPSLAKFAETNLNSIDLDNAKVIIGDGKEGYAPEAPYDRIIATAAASEVPKALYPQLEENGIMVLPIGPPFRCEMVKIQKTEKGEYIASRHGLFSFVPLV